MKTCAKCKIQKEISDFYTDKSKKDSLCTKCKTCIKEAHSIYYQNNSDERKEYQNQWRKQNPEYDIEYGKNWQKINRGKKNATTAKRHAAKLKATPKWLSIEQLKEIEEIYICATDLSWLSEDGLEVDHIVPLQGKSVSGLHVPWNLQIIPSKQNSSKGNKF